MAQPIYSTSVVIDTFKGINQTGDGANMSMRYAEEMENVNVHNGSFSQMRQGKVLPQTLDYPIGTLAYLNMRYGTNAGKTVLVAILWEKISDSQTDPTLHFYDLVVYTKDLDGDDAWVKRRTIYSGQGYHEAPSADFDWLTYEVNQYPMYNEKKTYTLNERCMHAVPPPDPPEPDPPVVSAVELYAARRGLTAGTWDPNNWNKVLLKTDESGENTYSHVIPIHSESKTYNYRACCARDETTPGVEQKTYVIYECRNYFGTTGEWNSDDWNSLYTVYPFSESDDYDYSEKCVIEEYPEEDEEEEEEEEYVPVYKNYKCKSVIVTPEAWTDAHWEEITTDDTVDVLLFTNATYGMYCLYGDTLTVSPVWITPDPENHPEENIKFGVIARYNERIWGSGIEGDPDKIMYSVPYSPFDWTPNQEIPEDGAGDNLIPTWDGDSFRSLRQIGSDLLAIKRNSIWRIYGTHPGEFVFTKMYGGGTIEEDTVAVYNRYAYMLGEHGLLRYDGEGAYAYLQDVIQKLMKESVNHAAMDKCCAAMRNGVYCLALPINGSDYCNAILEYDPNENQFALRTGVSVDSFLQYDERLFYTSATEPGRVIELTDEVGAPLPVKWISGYQDLGLKNSIKSAFILYMMVDSEAPVELRVGIRTEKKFKQKIIYTKPSKMTRLHLNTQGRQFRLEILSYSGIPFTIAGGMKLDLELDPD